MTNAPSNRDIRRLFANWRNRNPGSERRRFARLHFHIIDRAPIHCFVRGVRRRGRDLEIGRTQPWSGHWLMARLLQPRLQCNLLCARGERRGPAAMFASRDSTVPFLPFTPCARACALAAKWQSRDKSDTVTWNARQLINHPGAPARALQRKG